MSKSTVSVREDDNHLNRDTLKVARYPHYLLPQIRSKKGGTAAKIVVRKGRCCRYKKGAKELGNIQKWPVA